MAGIFSGALSGAGGDFSDMLSFAEHPFESIIFVIGGIILTIVLIKVILD